MGRIFKDCFEMIREMDRELKVSGITVPVNHYQNQELSGDDRLTKELIGVSFVISKPYLGKRETGSIRVRAGRSAGTCGRSW